ncbi:ead/Ea22-like family protein [Klebsiella pneumoniae]
MTDITELAQSMKAAAEKATPGEWVYFPKNTSIEYDVGSDESQGAILYVDSGDFTQAQTDRNGEFIALANPANILALVEALEKAQQTEKTLESRNRRLDGINTAAEKRIAELEFRTVTAAAADVLAERKRQVSAEGWTPGHDDEYEHGELADAAGCYALSSELFDCAGEPPRPWPWPDEWWKPTNRRRDLVKAGALILAEIERLDRAAGIKVEAE